MIYTLHANYFSESSPSSESDEKKNKKKNFPYNIILKIFLLYMTSPQVGQLSSYANIQKTFSIVKTNN